MPLRPSTPLCALAALAALACQPVATRPGSFTLDVFVPAPPTASAPSSSSTRATPSTAAKPPPSATSSPALGQPLPADTLPGSSPPTQVATLGGGSSGGRSEPSEPLVVRDAFDRPIAGAVVRLADGRTRVSDAAGEIRYPGSFPAGRAEVAHPEFVPSLVLGLDAIDALHLRPGGGRSGAFDERTIRVAGRVTWPLADLGATAAGFQADRPVFGLNGSVAPADGTFAVDVVTAAPGDPRGSFVLAGADAGGTLLYGVSAAFSPFAGEAPEPVALARADRTVAYSLAAPLPDLPDVTAQVELVRADAPLVVLERRAAASGTWLVAELPGTLRYSFEARSLDGRRDSVAAGPPRATLLPPPAAIVDAAARSVAWPPVAGAVGYLIALTADGRAGTTWEAWTPTATALVVPADLWPASGEVVVRAVDAPGFGARQIASLRDQGPSRLRLEPWLGAATYRVASTRVRF